jgi:DNA topoisomerase-2
LTATGTIRTFATTNEILVEFYVTRISAYAERRRHLIQHYQEQLTYIDAKIKFIKLVLDNKLDIRNTKPYILEQAKHYEISRNLCEEFLKMSILSLSKEKVEAMEEERKQLRVALDNTQNTSPEQFYTRDLNEMVKTKKRKREV